MLEFYQLPSAFYLYCIVLYLKMYMYLKLLLLLLFCVTSIHLNVSTYLAFLLLLILSWVSVKSSGIILFWHKYMAVLLVKKSINICLFEHFFIYKLFLKDGFTGYRNNSAVILLQTFRYIILLTYILSVRIFLLPLMSLVCNTSFLFYII